MEQLLRPQNDPMGGLICRGVTLFTNVKFREPLVRLTNQSKDPFVPISKYSPPGLTTPFSKRYFKPVKGARIGTAVSRGRTNAEQADYADRLCVKIPLLRWTELDESGKPFTPPVVSGLDEDCVSLVTVKPKFLLQLTFESPNEYEMQLLEPSEESRDPVLISRFEPKSESGGTHSRKKFRMVEPCRTAAPAPFSDQRRQTIVYHGNARPPRGSYRVLVIKRHDCEDVLLTFSLTISSDITFDTKISQRVKRKGFKVDDTVAVFFVNRF